MGTRRRVLSLTLLGLCLAGAGLATILLFGPAHRPRVLLIGLDGAEWDIINPLIDQGKLPNLASLKKEGVYGDLRSFEPILSPIIWTSIATGKRPEKHGVGWFMVESEKTGQRLPVTSNVRKCKAFWNIMKDRHIPTGVIGWWASYPAEQVPGFIVTDFIAYHNFGVSGQAVKSDLGKTYPLDLIDEIAPLVVSPSAIPPSLVQRFAHVSDQEIQKACGGAYDFSNPLSHFVNILATAQTYTAIGTRLYEREHPDVFAVYYEGIDSVGHLFMKYADPAMPGLLDENRARYRDLVEEYYEYQDEILGRYLALAGPETTVIVVSDHGFKTGDERPLDGETIPVGMAHHWHDLEGVVLMKGPGMKKGAEIPEASVLDVTPTLLYAMGLPVARDMDGSVILDAFRISYLKTHPLQRIASYEEGSGEATATGVTVDENIAKAMESRLKSLGYLGDSAEDSSPQIHLNLANQHLSKGNLAEAERELKLALRMMPNNPQPHLLLAQIYAQENRLLEVKNELKYAMSLDPANVSVWMRFAGVAAELGQFEEALSALNQVQESDPEWPGLRVATGDVLNRLGRLDESEAVLRQATSRHPDSVAAAFNLALVLEKQEKHEEALQAYRKVVELAPDHAYAHNNMGNILAALGRDEEALDHFATSVKNDPENFAAVYNLGTTCLKLGRYEEALRHLKKAVVLKPDGLYAHKNLALAYLKTENPGRAYREYLAMTRLHPTDYESWVQAARLLKRPEREGEVVELLGGAWLLDHERTARLIAEDPAFKGINLDRVRPDQGPRATPPPATRDEDHDPGAPKASTRGGDDRPTEARG